jgi:hypothetical protein
MTKTQKILTTVIITGSVLLGITTLAIYNLNNSNNSKIATTQSSSTTVSKISSTSTASSSPKIESSANSVDAKSSSSSSQSLTTNQNSSSGETTEIIDGVTITYLDSNNPPQYIKDYESCETKDPSKYDFGFYYETQIKFRCPKNIFYYGCDNYVLFSRGSDQGGIKSKDGYICDPKFGIDGERGGCFYLEISLQDNQELINKLLYKSFNAGNNCISITKEKLSLSEINSINASLKGPYKLIIYSK